MAPALSSASTGQSQPTVAEGGRELDSSAAVMQADDSMPRVGLPPSRVSTQAPRDSADNADSDIVTECHSESQLTLAAVDHQLDLISRSELRHLLLPTGYTAGFKLD